MKLQLTQRTAVALTLALVATVACSGSNTTGDNNGNPNGGCTITLSGPQSGSPACSNFSAVLDRGENRTGFTFSSTSGATTLTVSVSVAGEPTTGTFGKNAGADGVLILRNGTSEWGADNASGTYSVTITSVSLTQTTPTLKVYTAHGTMAATLAPVDGTPATGTVTLNATF